MVKNWEVALLYLASTSAADRHETAVPLMLEVQNSASNIHRVRVKCVPLVTLLWQLSISCCEDCVLNDSSRSLGLMHFISRISGLD